MDLEGNNFGQAAGSGAMPALGSIHDTSQTNPGISEDEMIDQQVDQLIASCGPIREGVFDNLGAILAPYQPGYSGGTGLDVNGSGYPTQQFQGATGSTPQMATQQSADWSCSEEVSASSSWSLACSQRYTNFQADPYHFRHSDQPGSSLPGRYGFTNTSLPIAGPSTTNYTSIISYSQSGSSSYYLHAGSGSYLNPPNTSSMARSLSTSDVPSMAAVPGDFSDLSASASSSGAPTYGLAQHTFIGGQFSSVNARPDDQRTAPGITISHVQGYPEFPAFGESVSSLTQYGTTSQEVPFLLEPARLPPKPKRRPPSKSSGDAPQTAGTSGSGGPMAEGVADQDDTTLEEDTRWIERNMKLATLMGGLRLHCRVRGRERAQAFRDLGVLFGEMADLCFGVRHIQTERQHVSHRSIVR
jgi:hypothetical protein